ncbi:hypothetical protein HanXRQr2_Chr09g0405381 [Helianthus annuus]|uniref:Uncharacterized protein n=1 Tax=Helianthus annuus TaxID=4232 RepID=A0A9K3N9I8_HELAN|nr:hypothetical protein HanXRQr2_Chr09g0405381 [Helianthus annuus]KAJ0894640.1 hypothetical protein HanPSC8_Chr09g0391301 [Helianthus annuus]
MKLIICHMFPPYRIPVFPPVTIYCPHKLLQHLLFVNMGRSLNTRNIPPLPPLLDRFSLRVVCCSSDSMAGFSIW